MIFRSRRGPCIGLKFGAVHDLQSCYISPSLARGRWRREESISRSSPHRETECGSVGLLIGEPPPGAAPGTKTQGVYKDAKQVCRNEAKLRGAKSDRADDRTVDAG